MVFGGPTCLAIPRSPPWLNQGSSGIKTSPIRLLGRSNRSHWKVVQGLRRRQKVLRCVWAMKLMAEMLHISWVSWHLWKVFAVQTSVRTKDCALRASVRNMVHVEC